MIIKRCFLIYVFIVLLVFLPPLMLYQTTVVSAEPITITATMYFLGALGLGAVGGYEAYQHRDTIATGTAGFREQVSELWEGQKAVGKFAWDSISLGSKYFYKKLATGIFDTEIESSLSSELIAEIKADIAELEALQDLEKMNDMFMAKYELNKIHALSINNYINAPYEDDLYQNTFIDGYTSMNSYNFFINTDTEKVKQFETLGGFNTFVNTSVKVTHQYYDTDMNRKIIQQFVYQGNYYKIEWKFYEDHAVNNMVNPENVDKIRFYIYQLTNPLTAEYTKIYSLATSQDRNDDLRYSVLEALEDNFGINLGTNLGVRTLDDLVPYINLGGTGTNVYPPVCQTTIAVPNLGLEDLQNVSDDNVQALVGSIDANLNDEDTYPIALDYDGTNVSVGDVTIAPDGSITGSDGGTGVIPVTGNLDLTIPSEIELDFSPLMVFGEELTEKFPFCIPWDIKRSIEALVVPPEAPKWVIEFDSNYFVGGGSVDIDFSQFESLAKIVRWAIFSIFCLGLMLKTRNIIRG